MNTPSRRWAESEIETLVGMGRVVPDEKMATPPAPVKRRIMEQEPVVVRPPHREEVEAIEDQILRMAFKKAMRTLKIRTLAIVFCFGIVTGFLGLGLTLMFLIYRTGS